MGDAYSHMGKDSIIEQTRFLIGLYEGMFRTDPTDSIAMALISMWKDYKALHPGYFLTPNITLANENIAFYENYLEQEKEPL